MKFMLTPDMQSIVDEARRAELQKIPLLEMFLSVVGTSSDGLYVLFNLADKNDSSISNSLEPAPRSRGFWSGLFGSWKKIETETSPAPSPMIKALPTEQVKKRLYDRFLINASSPEIPVLQQGLLKAAESKSRSNAQIKQTAWSISSP